jgi:hypothetical protein
MQKLYMLWVSLLASSEVLILIWNTNSKARCLDSFQLVISSAWSKTSMAQTWSSVIQWAKHDWFVIWVLDMLDSDLWQLDILINVSV